MIPSSEAVELAAELDMFEQQIYEWAHNHADNLPHPWRVDEWMIKYREFYEAQNK